MRFNSLVRHGLGRSGPLLDTAALLRAGLAVCAALLFALPAQAQTGELSGRVVDQTTGQPMEGAQVMVVGTNISARTRADGLYNLLGIPAGSQQIRALIIGYATQTATLTIQSGVTTTLDFQLSRAVVSLDAMVVTGQAGEISRKQVGNTISQISARDIEALPTPTASDVLQGMAAGVTVMDNVGQAGAGKQIRLRGHNSVSQGNTPLIYVDGIRISEQFYAAADEAGFQAPSPLDDINPADIDRVEIIKGAAATTLYGTQASAGVIQIFTKRGSQSAPRWSVGIDQGFNTLGHIGPSKDVNPTGLGMNNCNFTGISGDPTFATGDAMFPADSSCPASGSWLSSGHLQRYNVSVRGGGEQLNYFVSGRMGRENGVLGDQGSEEYSVRGNFGFSPGRTFTILLNNAYTRRQVTWIPDGNNREGFLLNVMRGEQDYTPGHLDGQILDMGLLQTINHFTTGLTVNWNPLPGMSHRLNAGLDFAASDYEEDHPWGYWGDPPGSRENDQYQTRTLTLDYAGSWSARLSGAFTSRFSAGAQIYEDNRYRLNGFGEQFAGPGDKVLDNGSVTSVNEFRFRQTNGGFFFQEEIGFADRLFVTGGLRFDGFSTFGEDYGMAMYPKVSLAYNVSEESFWPGWWDGMKLRAAWGESGRAPGAFDALKTWEPVSGDEGRPGVTPATLGNPDLGPERSREFEFGFEAAMFNGRVGLEFTRYQQKTIDALIPVQQVPSLGFIGSQLQNVGELKNSGMESQLNLAVLRGGQVEWDVGLRYGTNRSEVVNLGEIQDIYVGWRQRIRPCNNPDGTKAAEAIAQEAYRGEGNFNCPIPGYWHDVVVNDSATVENPNGFTAPGTDPIMEERYLGPSYPTDLLGVSFTVRVGRWLTVDAVGEGQFGHFLSSGVAYQNARRAVWPLCRETQTLWDVSYDTAYDAVIAGGGTSTEARAAGRAAQRGALNAYEKARCIRGFTTYGMWIQPADFFKLRALSVQFRLPSRLIPGTRSAVLQLQARNLFRITSFDGLDPEASEEGGTQEVLLRQEYYNLPPYRSFIVGLRLEF